MPTPARERPDPDQAIFIVTGSTLSAEAFDRPLAYALRERLLACAAEHGLSAGSGEGELGVLVLSDLWYVNQPALADRPVISIGPPNSNALTAALADKLPSIHAIEGRHVVQFDPDGFAVAALCWGEGDEETARAVAWFGEHALADFVRAANL